MCFNSMMNFCSFILLLCFAGFAYPHFATAGQSGNETDRLALLAFKHSILQDPQRALSSWNDSFHFCQWEGVTCGRRHQRVTRLDFESKGLSGSLSPYVGNLSFLRVLWIYNNSFHGEIPLELGHLFRLQRLGLSMNKFEGEIQANISFCLNLEYLGVGYNSLVGKLPKELSALSKLKTLVVHGNNLTGAIPPFIGNLTSLESISAAYNLFEGSITDSIGQLKKLSLLGLGGNRLSGMIPTSVYNLSLLTILSLSGNELQGSLLPSIGLMLPNLKRLQLWSNQLTGTLPPSLSNCSGLEILEIGTNNFNGKITIDFGGLKKMRMILLQKNNFGSGELDEMKFLGSMVNCSNLELLELADNRLRGSLPNLVGNLSSQLYFLDLGANQLYGRLPSTIGNLVNLTNLYLYYNQFTGTLPSSIGHLAQMKRMYIQLNEFSGAIPDSIGNLSVLTELSMEMNRFDGIIPKSFGNCQRLLFLELSQNNLGGSIPKQLFRVSALSILLNFSGNHLNGSLSVDVGNLKMLGSLDLSKNDLSGEIPISLGSCISLEILFLQENNFQGSIPSSLSSLKGVTNLDLSRNNLSGKIPGFFEQFSLKYLNLSFNNFEGEVPVRGVFANQSAISIVGNNKLCGGMPELHLHKCSSEESKKHQGRSRTLIIVVSIICTLLCITIMLGFLFFRHKKTSKAKSSGLLLNEPFLRVSYEQLLKATNGFSLENLVGRGSFGSVYKGILDANDMVVAVKVLNLESQGASKSFMIECEALRNIRHRNLVKIITSCSSIDFRGNGFKALVYDFMPNGSLDRWLHSSQEAQNELHELSFLERINIAIDVACALDYLHHQCEHPIIHCDLKPSNILLDRDMVAHVGDFGVAKFLLPELVNQGSSIQLRGTIGYAAPEYGLGNEVSTNGDVYSFGILLLEMMTGKRPTDSIFKEGHNLHNFAKVALLDHGKGIADSEILKNNKEEWIVSAIKIGVTCSAESPQARMSITNVIHELNLVRGIILQHSEHRFYIHKAK